MNNNSKAKWLRESKEIGQQRQERKRKEAKVKAEKEALAAQAGPITAAALVAKVEKVKSCLTNDSETKQSDPTPEEQATAAATVRRLLGGAK